MTAVKGHDEEERFTEGVMGFRFKRTRNGLDCLGPSTPNIGSSWAIIYNAAVSELE